MTDFKADELWTVYDEAAAAASGNRASSEGIVAVAKHVEQLTIEKAASQETQASLLAEIAHQLTRLANASNKPAPIITAEQAIGQWPLKGGMYSELAVGYLEALGIHVEIDPNS
jgi:hypothetical protein